MVDGKATNKLNQKLHQRIFQAKNSRYHTEDLFLTILVNKKYLFMLQGFYIKNIKWLRGGPIVSLMSVVLTMLYALHNGFQQLFTTNNMKSNVFYLLL